MNAIDRQRVGQNRIALGAVEVSATRAVEARGEPPPMSAIDQVVEATVDALSYRLLAQEAIDQLHQLTCRLDQADRVIRELREQLRARS